MIRVVIFVETRGEERGRSVIHGGRLWPNDRFYISVDKRQRFGPNLVL